MKISPISNNYTSFGAKLPKKDLNTLLDSALTSDKEAGIPKLYTLLEKLDKMPGENAELKSWIRNSQSELIGYRSEGHSGHSCQLRIDGQLIEEGSNVYDMLYSAVNSAKTQEGKKIRMPQAVFDTEWWPNRLKTRTDVEALLK